MDQPDGRIAVQIARSRRLGRITPHKSACDRRTQNLSGTPMAATPLSRPIRSRSVDGHATGPLTLVLELRPGRSSDRRHIRVVPPLLRPAVRPSGHDSGRCHTRRRCDRIAPSSPSATGYGRATRPAKGVTPAGNRGWYRRFVESKNQDQCHRIHPSGLARVGSERRQTPVPSRTRSTPARTRAAVPDESQLCGPTSRCLRM
jgi:hypothetical protein